MHMLMIMRLQDSTFVTRVDPFTTSHNTARAYADRMAASGGGDGPEAVAAGMDEVLRMDWRKEAVKVCVLIADAPPHGLGESGDGFPNGDPDGRDPLRIANRMAERGIVVFCVACEPTLSTSYRFARDFFASVARITGGQLVPLASARVSAQVNHMHAVADLNFLPLSAAG